MVLKYERRNINIEDACTTRALPIPSANAAIIYVCLLLSLILSKPYDDLSLCGGLVRALGHTSRKHALSFMYICRRDFSPLFLLEALLSCLLSLVLGCLYLSLQGVCGDIGWDTFLAVCFLFETNPPSRKHFCCGKQLPKCHLSPVFLL